ncbi:hypothetical protein [Shewanella woodyi]|uniref:hypothetical protein n=1 Tax=Shewanella woodyi TaxID=60961 RepID=UPI003748113E
MSNIVFKNSMTFDISFRYSVRLKSGGPVRQYWPLFVVFLGRKLYKFFSLNLIVLLMCMTNVVANSSAQTSHNNSQVNSETIDNSLTRLEVIRTQSPEVVSNQLLKIAPRFDDMNQKQKYRFILLQAHSYALSGNFIESTSLLKAQLSKPFSDENVKYRTRMMSLLANTYSHYNHYVEALKTLHQLLPLLVDVDDIETEVHGYSLAAELFKQMNLHEEALKYSGALFSKIDKIKLPRHQCFTSYSYAESVNGAYGSDKTRWLQIQSLYSDSYRYCASASEEMIMAASLLGQAKILFI